MSFVLDAFEAIKGTSIPAILVVAGIIFVLLAMAGGFTGKIQIPRHRQKWAGIIGVVLLFSGISLFAVPVPSKPDDSRRTDGSIPDSNDYKQTAPPDFNAPPAELPPSDSESNSPPGPPPSPVPIHSVTITRVYCEKETKGLGSDELQIVFYADSIEHPNRYERGKFDSGDGVTFTGEEQDTFTIQFETSLYIQMFEMDGAKAGFIKDHTITKDNMLDGSAIFRNDDQKATYHLYWKNNKGANPLPR